MGTWTRVAGLCSFLMAAAVPAWPAGVGDLASSFKSTTLEGQGFDLGEYLGRVPVLLDFGSIYCSSCVTTIPDVIKIQNRHGQEKLRVVQINLDVYGISRVRRFYGQYRQSLVYPVVLDAGLEISRAFGVTALPTYILIGADGKIAYSQVGYDEQKMEKLEQVVASAVEKGVPSPAAEPLEQVVLLAPDSFTKTYQDSMSIVGLTGGRKGPFTLRLNGGSEKQAKSYGKMFWVRTPLSLGSNHIEVRYPSAKGETSQAVILFREPLMGPGLQVSFPEFRFHTPDRESRCSSCHKMEAESASEISASTTFCLRCHEHLAKQAYVHGPIPVGGCGPCHDFASKPHKYDLLNQGSALCFTCHDDIRDKFAKPFLHGPVAVGLCVVCHSPHGSSFKYQIRAPQGDLCLSCHENMKPKVARFVKHRPFADGNCAGCHDPHSSESPSYFLRAKGDALCRLCHQKEAMASHKHPVSRAPKFTLEGMRLDPEGNLVCQSCHDPHATDNERMSPAPGGCSGCHKM